MRHKSSTGNKNKKSADSTYSSMTQEQPPLVQHMSMCGILDTWELAEECACEIGAPSLEVRCDEPAGMGTQKLG